jgi:hypothetical protein
VDGGRGRERVGRSSRFKARRRVHPSTAGEYLKEAVQRRRKGRCWPGSVGHGSAGHGWRSRAAAPAWRRRSRRRSGSGGDGAGRGAEETRGRWGPRAVEMHHPRDIATGRCACKMQQALQTPLE